MALAELLIGIVVAFLLILVVIRSVRIVPQARARNVERFGRYHKTLEPGMNRSTLRWKMERLGICRPE